MTDFASARAQMVKRQLVARGIIDTRVLAAMQEVERHLFVEKRLQSEAYSDNPLPIGEDQTISQPYMVAVMTEALDLDGDERVLEIGTGSGYQAGILSRLCKWVYTVERLSPLSEQARTVLRSCGYDNISFLVADGTRGWPAQAPFDGIIVTAGSPRIPDTLVEQLADGGLLVIPVGDRFSQTLKKVRKAGQKTYVESHTGCRFVDLIGEYGWSEYR